ncbi:hypothetical protein TNCV_3559951 [Trichonephila clavipes]|uniref:Uncharacterized protein n=1 Tax=Trichonephila clavipes TaxID=2585209 RepID=A0A8X6WDC6_TRICX|nr:hypothetical protein TNCV_3559951 [Trichonephila clavipes]
MYNMFSGERIIVENEEPAGHPRRSCAAEQFHSDVSFEAVESRAPNISKNWQWTTEGDVSAQRSTPAPHQLPPGS